MTMKLSQLLKRLKTLELDYSMSKVMVWVNTTIFQFPKNCFGKNFRICFLGGIGGVVFLKYLDDIVVQQTIK